MICRNTNVSDSRFEHSGYAVEYAASRCNLLALVVAMGWEGVEVTEQFVCAVDEIDIHARTLKPQSVGIDEPSGSPSTIELSYDEEAAKKCGEAGNEMS